MNKKTVEVIGTIKMVVGQVSLLKSLNGRRFKSSADFSGKWPVCDECGAEVRYVYEDGKRFNCYDCVGKNLGREEVLTKKI